MTAVSPPEIPARWLRRAIDRGNSSASAVAREAGVNPCTVQRHLRGSHPLGELARIKVRRACVELGFGLPPVPASRARRPMTRTQTQKKCGAR